MVGASIRCPPRNWLGIAARDVIAHYHTAGNPGRAELDATQEINYPAIMQAILATGYRGFVAQEFIPTWPDKIESLRHAAKVCDG